MIQVRAPDGSIVQFPDGTPPATIQAAMAHHYGGPQQPQQQNGRSLLDVVRQGVVGTPPATPAQRDAREIASDPDTAAVGPMANAFFLGYGPEVAGGLQAASTGIANFFHQGRGYGMGDAYAATRDAQRAQLAATSAAHPVVAGTEGLLGMFGNPLSLVGGEYVGAAKGLGQTVLRSAQVGTGLGAVAGSGYAGPGHRVEGAVDGGAVGGVLGAATPPAAGALRAVATRVGNVARGAAQGAQAAHAPAGAPTPEQTQLALQQVQQLAKGAGQDPAALAAPYGKPLTTAEAIGRTGVQSLGALARRPGDTADALEALIADRRAGMPQRVGDDFQAATGIHPAAAAGDMDMLTQQLQAQAKPLFDKALSSTDPVWNDNLQNLAQRPVIAKAINSVGNDVLNAGQSPFNIGLRLDPDTGWTMAEGKIGDVSEPQPTAATWDMVRKAVGRQVARNPITNAPLPDSQSEGNYGVRIATRDLSSELRSSIPGYGDALDASGDYLKLQDAFARGRKLFGSSAVDSGTLGDVYDNLSPPEQQAFLGGGVANVNDALQNNRFNPNSLSVPNTAAKWQSTIGPDAFSDLADKANTEGQMLSTGSRMSPNAGSPTMEYLNSAANHDADSGSIFSALGGMAHNPAKLLSGLSNFGQDATSVPVRNEMGRILMQPPGQTAAQLFNLPPPPPSLFDGLMPPATPIPALLGGYAAQQMNN